MMFKLRRTVGQGWVFVVEVTRQSQGSLQEMLGAYLVIPESSTQAVGEQTSA